MKKWIALAVALAALLLGYVVAGPYLAIRGIHRALDARDIDGLARYVDYDALRTNLQAQVDDRLARAAGDIGGPGIEGYARQIVGQLSGHAIDAMVSPAGIAALLEGRALTRRATGQDPRANPDGTPARYEPISGAKTRYESPARFTATVQNAEGQPVVFVFQRNGLTWKLGDIRLP